MREGARDRRLEGLDYFGLFEPLNVTEKFGFPVAAVTWVGDMITAGLSWISL